ncbi:TetR/AcrR family transcriptional regulator [Mycobacterium sp. MAA66]|uniref:TetR/AcrR family transcriptional regulator n=1 Tax=Mycobacterium sp. MAA66 TaxID=3156297 RepID=UPI0035164AF4
MSTSPDEPADPQRQEGRSNHDRYSARFHSQRGELQREAILESTRELLRDNSFNDISVTSIASRAGIGRSGFYFYFDSKHAVLAAMLEDRVDELDEMTDHFAARAPDESPEQFVSRMVSAVATVIARNDPVVVACHAARHADGQIRTMIDALNDAVIAAVHKIIAAEIAVRTAAPIVDNTSTLVRVLSAATQFVAAGDTTFVPSATDRPHALRVIEQLWLHAFWNEQY